MTELTAENQALIQAHGFKVWLSTPSDLNRLLNAARGQGVLSDEALDAKTELAVVEWQGKLHCAYLNDHRIVGGKPWGGGDIAKSWSTSLREVIRAFPELQRSLGFDYLGNRISNEPRP